MAKKERKKFCTVQICSGPLFVLSSLLPGRTVTSGVTQGQYCKRDSDFKFSIILWMEKRALHWVLPCLGAATRHKFVISRTQGTALISFCRCMDRIQDVDAWVHDRIYNSVVLLLKTIKREVFKAGILLGLDLGWMESDGWIKTNFV